MSGPGGRDDRRRFLAGAIGLCAATPGLRLVGLVEAAATEPAAAGTVRWGMLIDVEKCATDCDACVRACDAEFGLETTARPEIDAHYLRKLALRDPQSGREWSAPMLCQHCEHPPCVDVCPTGASLRRADGIVLVDKHTCIGCRYCMMACPFGARSFIHAAIREPLPHAPRGQGTVESCNLCAHRVDRGKPPACVEACARDGHGAMRFGDLHDPGGDLARELRAVPSREVRAALGLDTGVRYAGF